MDDEGGGERRAGTARTVLTLVGGQRHRFAPGGDGLFQERVLRAGSEYLSGEAISSAFPGESDNPVDVSQVAVAPDGTLVLGVYRFRHGLPAEGAIELWRGRELSGAFLVPTAYFAGGFAFTPDSERIATFSTDGTLTGVFDRRGRLVSGLLESAS